MQPVFFRRLTAGQISSGRAKDSATPHHVPAPTPLTFFKVAHGKDPREAPLRHVCLARAVRDVLAGDSRRTSKCRHQCEAARDAAGEEAGGEEAGSEEAGAEGCCEARARSCGQGLAEEDRATQG